MRALENRSTARGAAHRAHFRPSQPSRHSSCTPEKGLRCKGNFGAHVWHAQWPWGNPEWSRGFLTILMSIRQSLRQVSLRAALGPPHPKIEGKIDRVDDVKSRSPKLDSRASKVPQHHWEPLQKRNQKLSGITEDQICGPMDGARLTGESQLCAQAWALLKSH